MRFDSSACARRPWPASTPAPFGLVLLLPLLAAAAPLLAQPIVVDPNGGGQFTSLHAALAAAPAGATIRVVGGSWGPITIRKSVTIFGDPPPRIAAPVTGMGVQPAAITLDGDGAQVVVLSRIVVAGRADGGIGWNRSGPAIGGGGFAAIRIHDSTLRAPEWMHVNGLAHGAPALSIDGPATIQVERSTLQASTSSTYDNDRWAPDGAPGIDAQEATVVVLDSTVAGGSVGPSSWTIPPDSSACPCPQGTGQGGPGVFAQSLYHSDSLIVGGRGGEVRYANTPFGRQPDGPSHVAGSVRELAADLVAGAPMHVGRPYDLFLVPPSPLPTALAIGAIAVTPLPVLTGGVLFLQPNAMVVLALPANATSVRVPVPPVAPLAGAELGFQRVSLFGPGAAALGNPVMSVILP